MSEPGTLGPPRRDQTLALTTAFLSLFSIVGVALYGLPFFYDFFVEDLGWSRAQVTSGNALSKLLDQWEEEVGKTGLRFEDVPRLKKGRK